MSPFLSPELVRQDEPLHTAAAVPSPAQQTVSLKTVSQPKLALPSVALPGILLQQWEQYHTSQACSSLLEVVSNHQRSLAYCDISIIGRSCPLRGV